MDMGDRMAERRGGKTKPAKQVLTKAPSAPPVAASPAAAPPSHRLRHSHHPQFRP